MMTNNFLFKPKKLAGIRKDEDHLYQMLYGGISSGEIRSHHEARSGMLDRIEQMGEHAFLRSNFVCGIKRLPVRMHLI